MIRQAASYPSILFDRFGRSPLEPGPAAEFGDIRQKVVPYSPDPPGGEVVEIHRAVGGPDRQTAQPHKPPRGRFQHHQFLQLTLGQPLLASTDKAPMQHQPVFGHRVALLEFQGREFQ